MCDEIEDSRHIPSNWREHLLNCRNCKQNLVLYISKYYLKTVSKSIMPGKSLILAGCFEDPINAVPQHGVLYEMEYLSQTHYRHVMQRKRTPACGYIVSNQLVTIF